MAGDELAALRQELNEVKADLDEARQQLAFARGQVRTLTGEEPKPNGRYPQAGPTTWYEVEDWVVGFMQHLLERRVSNTRRWCPQWYDHPEVATRFRLLYESYKEISTKLDAVSYSRWFLEHLDPHLDAIFSEDGPFAACSPERHAPHRGLTIARCPNPDAYRWGQRPAPPSGDPAGSRNNTPARNSAPATRP